MLKDTPVFVLRKPLSRRVVPNFLWRDVYVVFVCSAAWSGTGRYGPDGFAVADSIAVLLEDEGKRKWLGHMAEKRRIPQEQNLLLKELLEESDDEQTERITGDHTGL